MKLYRGQQIARELRVERAWCLCDTRPSFFKRVHLYALNKVICRENYNRFIPVYCRLSNTTIISEFSFFGTRNIISCPRNKRVKLFKWQHANTYQVQNGSRNFCQGTRNTLILWRPKLICVNNHFLHHRKHYVPRYRANTTSLFV
jgi:hypothetical protein